MKKNFMNILSDVRWLTAAFSLSLAFTLGSCTEEIDESNFTIAEKQTVSEYVASVDSFSSIKALFDRVKLGNTSDASSLTSVLSSRGNYTVFLPGDQAFRRYLDSIGVADVASLTDEQADVIANSCVIDNGSQSPYELADFPVEGAFSIPNLKSRLLDCSQDSLGDYTIGTMAKVLKFDIELSNGMVHVIDAVIAPSNKTLPALIAAADNMQIMGHLLQATTWCDSLNLEIDREYENTEHPETYNFGGSLKYQDFNYPDHRFYGYTAFVETDDVFASEWNISVPENGDWSAVMQQILTECKKAYPESSHDDDFSHPDNAVNQFVAYHLFKGKIAYNKLVCHYNEYGYKYGDNSREPKVDYPINVWDYFTTMGKYPALIKVVQLGKNGLDPQTANQDYVNFSIFLNRISTYANGRHDDYHEISAVRRGIKVFANNGKFDNNSANGYYFPIDGILLNDRATRDALGRERIRIDFNTVLHELPSNNFRHGDYTIFPNGYFENVCNESADTKMTYLFAGKSDRGGNWNDYKGDELLTMGLYDFTIKLPPVPKSGTYEIRLGQAFNSERGMCQIYFGDSPYHLQPAGLPLDQRQSTNNNPSIPWLEDSEEDDQYNIEIDKNMRNQGFMKGPQYIVITNNSGKDPVRSVGGGYSALRFILGSYDLKANTCYYIRLKSALKKLDSQCFLDYIEYVPTNIYNGTEPEDIW